MKKTNAININAGFTLIELLVAMVMSAIVLTGIYSAYTSMMSTTVNETDLVDMQQEMRLAIDYISRDIKMAGAIISDDFDAIDDDSAPTDDTISQTLKLNTLSADYSVAIIDADLNVSASATSFTLTLVSSSMLGNFSTGDQVRITRPDTKNQVGDSDYYTITSIADIDDDDWEIVVSPSSTIADELSIKAGDVLTPYNDEAYQVVDGEDQYQETISWTLNGTALERQLNEDEDNTATIIENVSELSFEFLDEDGDKFTESTFSSEDVVAVRVAISAVTDGQLDKSERERELSTIVYLRNYTND
jgi:prepilin-type N-terminal cleavage/methylation domain-containing protein